MVKHFKKQSNRQSCKKRYKIEKKVRQHNKKVKKDAKKKTKKNRGPKDPGVPNSLPFKDKILNEAQQRRERQEEMRELRKKERLALVMQKRGLAEIAEDAEERDMEFEENELARCLGHVEPTKPLEKRSFKTFYREFQKVIEAADVVLEVLDARDPLGSRCPDVEKAVLEAGPSKRLVLVLNKIDLVPSDNLQAWLKYLKNEFPTVPFKASTQVQRKRLSRGKYRFGNIANSEEIAKTSCCLGAELLMKLLGNYCRNCDMRTSVRVGIVGFPNVGKSSIINSLKRSRACTVGATPGVTRTMQEVQLDKHVVLLDSPGIVLAKGGTDAAAAALRNALKVECLSDVFPAVEAILRRTSTQQMMLYYRLTEYNDSKEFLQLLGKRLGKLKRGGVPDIEAAAKMLIKDWNSGKIRYFTRPPETNDLPAHISANIVAEMAKEFDLDSLQMIETEDIETLKNTVPVSYMDVLEVSGQGFTDGTTDGLKLEPELDDVLSQTGGQTMEIESQACDELGNVENMEVKLDARKQKMPSKVTAKKLAQEVSGLKPAEAILPGNQQINTNIKQSLKLFKKKQRRTEKLADKLSDNLASSITLGDHVDDYDFKTDFK